MLLVSAKPFTRSLHCAGADLRLSNQAGSETEDAEKAKKANQWEAVAVRSTEAGVRADVPLEHDPEGSGPSHPKPRASVELIQVPSLSIL